MVWLGLVAVMVLLFVGQEWFAEIHRRRYGQWRSGRERWFFPNREERILMFQALAHRNPDRTVERVRIATVALIVFCFGAFIALYAYGVVGPSR
jgi:hypothetical protein